MVRKGCDTNDRSCMVETEEKFSRKRETIEIVWSNGEAEVSSRLNL